MANTPAVPATSGPLDWKLIRRGLAERKDASTGWSIIPKTGFTTEGFNIKGKDGNEVPVTVYKPEKPREGGAPLIVFYHGGGFTVGDRSYEEVNCRLFSVKLGCVCVNVEYRLAPEFPFPAAIDDSWAALKWVSHYQDAASIFR